MSDEKQDRDYYIRANNANQHGLIPYTGGYILAVWGVANSVDFPLGAIIPGLMLMGYGFYAARKFKSGTLSRRLHLWFSDEPSPKLPKRRERAIGDGGEQE
jgi:hypothetical protein